MSALAGSREAAAPFPLPMLVLVPPPENVSVSPGIPLLGLPLVRRTALAARRAGFGEVFWGGGPPDEELRAALDGAAVFGLTGVPEKAVRLPWNAVVTVDDLRALRAPFLESSKASTDQTGVTGDASPKESASGTFEEKTPKRSAGPLFVRTAQDIREAEKYLLQSLVKETDGFMARHVHRKISLFVSRRLASTRVTPNQMTLVSVGIGLVGALLFVPGEPSMQLPGALLFLLHSILDGCDGEIARLKLIESRWGGLLDFWGDNIVHVAVFAGIAVGWSRASGAAWPLGLGALAAGGTLLSAGFVCYSTMGKPSAAGGPLFVSVTSAPRTRISGVADALARRDFIYLVVVLAAFGEARWFLVVSAVGAPVFFLVLLAIARRGRHAERTPV
jgi:phosphatidylglycerophosphate synthase